MRIAFIRLVKDISVFKFQEYVKAATVGDDNASGISKVISDRYNMLTIAPIYNKLGYKVTGASKKAVEKPFIEFEDLVFIKRKFKFNEELGYVAPLDTDSIYKSLCFDKKDIGTTWQARLENVGRSAQREFFLHGRDAFDEFQCLLKPLAAENGIVQTYLNYDNLVQEYKSGTFTTLDL